MEWTREDIEFLRERFDHTLGLITRPGVYEHEGDCVQTVADVRNLLGELARVGVALTRDGERGIGVTDITTRELCQRCHDVSPVGFHARDDVWRVVAGRWTDSILCVRCFAQLGDEKHIAWEKGITLYPVSYATHHAGRNGEQAT